MKKLSSVLLLMLCFSMAFPFKQYAALDNTDEELKLYLGEVKVISVRNPTRVAIGNPLVADIAAVTKSDLTLSPKAAGNTTLVVWDNYGEQSYVVKVFNENTNLIKSRIDNILKQLKVAEVNTQAQDEEGKVFLLGKTKNDKEKEMILIALGPLKEKIVDLMTVKEEENVIEIDVQVFEINKGAEDKLGFKWPQTLDITEVGSPGIAAAGTSWGKLFKVANVTRDAFTLTLDALIEEGSARVLSRPRIACLSGKEAKLLVGGQVPVLSGSVTPGTSGAGSTGATTGASVEYKDYGIVLNIKPQVNEQGRVHINLNVEVSELGEKVQTDYALAYTFIKRSATSELILDDGQTMAIGGLIKQKTTEELQKFPWLGDVPVLGMFFRHKRVVKGGDATNREDVELFITLTPRIVSHAGKGKEARETVPADKYYIDETKDPVLRYSQLVQARILESLTYPPSARGSGFQGIVTLRINLSYKGEILESGIQSSSGYKILDDNALKTAKRISPYPPFPPVIKEKDLWINIPIAYQLD
ncbi:MAG: TonB family protein [Candidatus Omnitrophica bacterium]|nr:TonB family protein [Candidatus Omnitrophota bacterium]